MTTLIVGAGLTGATLAERLANAGEKVLIIDRHDHIAGSAHDFIDSTGILAHRYGAHIFHTKSEKVWRYLSRFTAFRPYTHKVLGHIDGKHVPLPFGFAGLDKLNIAGPFIKGTLTGLFGEDARVPLTRVQTHGDPIVSCIGELIRKHVYLGYTRKMWGCEPEDLPPAIMARVPVVMGYDDRYFDTPYQGMPDQGYTEMVRRMLDHPSISVELSTPYDRNYFKGLRTVYTGSIDEFFGYELGALPYRTMRFETYQGELPAAVVNYCSEDVPYIRDIDFPAMTDQERVSSTIYREYPLAHEPGRTDPHYPIQTPANVKLYQAYKAMAKGLDVHFCGRCGDYRYYNMDQAVAAALALYDDIRESRPIDRESLSVGAW